MPSKIDKIFKSRHETNYANLHTCLYLLLYNTVQHRSYNISFQSLHWCSLSTRQLLTTIHPCPSYLQACHWQIEHSWTRSGFIKENATYIQSPGVWSYGIAFHWIKIQLCPCALHHGRSLHGLSWRQCGFNIKHPTWSATANQHLHWFLVLLYFPIISFKKGDTRRRTRKCDGFWNVNFSMNCLLKGEVFIYFILLHDNIQKPGRCLI